jgi:hypothetical protein
MNEEFEPSPNFIENVMARVHQYEAERFSFLGWLAYSRPLRYALAGGGTVFGLLKAAPVF